MLDFIAVEVSDINLFSVFLFSTGDMYDKHF